MLLVLEIILTITAWKRGWKAWTLLAWPIALGTAFVVSLIRDAASGFVADIVLIGLLVIMTIKKRQTAQNHEVKYER
jgi:hypothetical protein